MPAPTTLKALYQLITRDHGSHQRTIGAALAKQTAHRRKLVKFYVDGLSDREVGAKTGRSHGAARCMLRDTMVAMMRDIRKLPRYYKLGRARTSPREARKRTLREQLGLPTVNTREIMREVESARRQQP